MVNGINQSVWAVQYILNHKNLTYTIKHVADLGSDSDVSDLFVPYSKVLASDELGAFNAGARLIRNLGFRPA